MSEAVACRSEGRYAERPTGFTWGTERLEVAQVLARWRFPQGLGFKVRTSDERLFELFYDQAADEWRITPG